MKAISASKLSALYKSAAVHFEESITDSRVADVVIEFETPQSPFGKGIACEVQHKHEEKETGQVTHAYLENGYSVLWAYESDFDFEEVDFNIPDHRFIRVWPNAVPEPKGRDLYPDSTPERVRSDLQRRDGPGQVPAKFPPIVRTVHQFDIRSPVHGKTNPEWEIYDKRKVHGVGYQQAWTIIYGHPALGSLFEIREIHRKENQESHLPLPIAPQDAPQFNRFCEAAHSNIEDNDVPHVKYLGDKPRGFTVLGQYRTRR